MCVSVEIVHLVEKKLTARTHADSAAAKFHSGCGWPAFDKCYKGAIETHVDDSLGMRRVEIVCAKCKGHQGHVFEGEHFTDTNERHCVNSLSIRYVKGDPPAMPEEAVTKNLKL